MTLETFSCRINIVDQSVIIEAFEMSDWTKIAGATY